MPDHVDRIVQVWRREQPDLDLAALVLPERLFRTAHLADAALAKPLAAHGLLPGRFDLLAALRPGGEPYALKPTHRQPKQRTATPRLAQPPPSSAHSTSCCGRSWPASNHPKERA
jgi:hypothetical protein